MKTDNQVKRERRHIKKEGNKRTKEQYYSQPIPFVLLNKTQQKPLTVTNGVTRRIFVAGQPVDVMTNYTQN